MNHLNNVDEKTLRELLSSTISDLSKNPNDINLKNQKKMIEEEISYVQHFGLSRKRRGYR